MSNKTWKAELSNNETKEFPELFEKIKKEFKDGVDYINNLWENGEIMRVLLEKDTNLNKYL